MSQPYCCERCGDIHNDNDLIPDCFLRDAVKVEASQSKPVTSSPARGIAVTTTTKANESMTRAMDMTIALHVEGEPIVRDPQ
jgi:hypothetical protein